MADPAKNAERARKWRAANPEAHKAIEQRTRTRHATEIRERAKRWRDENREHLQERSLLYHRQTRANTPWKHLLRSRFRDALKRNIPFELTPEWAASRWTGKCELTGITFDLTQRFSGFYSPSIDKIDPSKGYLPDNSRFILSSVNSFKGAATDLDMLNAAKALISNQNCAPLRL